MHLEMSTEISVGFTKKVEAVTAAEQNIVIGENAEGKKVSDVIGEISGLVVDPAIP